MASTSLSRLVLFLLILTCFIPVSISTSRSTSTLSSQQLSTLSSICGTTPHPNHCFEAAKLSLSLTLPPNLLSVLLHSFEAAVSGATGLSSLFSNTRLVERQKGAMQDCKDLHQVTLSTLQRSMTRVKSSDPIQLSEARVFLSAALTNKATCLEGLDSTSGPHKPALVASIVDAYSHVSNSLSLLSKTGPHWAAHKAQRGPKTGPSPRWLTNKARKTLEVDIGLGPSPDTGDEPSVEPEVAVTVAKDGTGNFTTVAEAVDWAPSNSEERTDIYVREGVYDENVEIPSYKTNIVLIGDGSDVTVITGSRSMADGWTTFRSATVAVSGDGFLARDMTFENSAGAAKNQAVALRINADLAAVYRCSIIGHQDTLYVHSFRQFYRECEISGTVDFIFGNAVVVLQSSNIVSRLPMAGQFTVITAQSRDTADEITGIVIHNCSIVASEDLNGGRKSGTVRSYLGRPWKVFARTVVMESYIDDFMDPAGWAPWSNDLGLENLYYGEYYNFGPGSGTDGRVKWPGYHIMEYEEATNFTVSEFIMGNEWLDSTSFPYDDGV